MSDLVLILDKPSKEEAEKNITIRLYPHNNRVSSNW